MKILALGGCGAMGKVAVETALELDPTLEIIIADLDGAAAEHFSNSFSVNVTGVQANALDADQLDDLMRPCDIVVSTIGPFYMFGSVVLEAAIRTKTHYIDICDDPEPTLAMFSLNEKAKQAGITAIVGAGSSPGTSNLLAATALALFDSPKEVYTFWGTGGPLEASDDDDMDLLDERGNPSAATVHWMEQLTGSVNVLENGKVTSKAPLSPVTMNFPGIGSDTSYVCGHPEPITLHRYYPSLQTSYNLMNMPGYIIYALKKATENVPGETQVDVKVASQKLGDLLSEKTMGLIDTAKYISHQYRDKSRTFFPDLAALVVGEDSAGSRMSVGVHLEGKMKIDDMAHSTCVPTAIILNMMTSGAVVKHGVFAPEACVDPALYFKHLGAYMTINEGFDEQTMLTITKSHG
jgi:saccharopine dehydrogenase-like NADP-dependent oxidoreductase